MIRAMQKLSEHISARASICLLVLLVVGGCSGKNDQASSKTQPAPAADSKFAIDIVEMTREQQLARGLDSEVIAILKSELGRNWHRTDSTDRTNGSPIVLFDIDPKPDDPSKIQLDEVLDVPTLFVHCGTDLQVMVKAGPVESPNLHVRFDDGPMLSERWNPSGTHLLSATPKPFVRKMLYAKILQLEYQPKAKPRATLTYNMADLSQVFTSAAVCTSKMK